ncbi:hypothetical protein [Polynucleobacter sp. Fuers-14]|uniref:hypothetical protein n=1 Tax=Polynucleobacter sp. Fuers-14 TaxID=1758364 RepID=UPI001C0E6B77|nr:hypothetical protein [Polynucleobacter sp. Fuers-14]MBU3640509.1 hypothetical protein [Polynucleobacter sp. Fuers-14]
MTGQDQAVENALLRRDVEELSQKVEELSADVKALVTAWQTANNIVVAVKYIAGAVAAIGVIWGAVKLYLSK